MKFFNLLLVLIFFSFSTSYTQVIFNEEFNDSSNPKGWPVGVEKFVANRSIENNTYSISCFSDSKFTFSSVEHYIDTNQDFEIEAAITDISSTNEGVGILFGHKDKDNHQVILITKNGYFRYGIKVNGIWSDIKNWEKFSSINTNYPANNKIQIIKEGNQIGFLINGDLAYQTNFIPFEGNRIGFKINSSQHASFDYLRVSLRNNQKKLFSTKKQLIASDDFSSNANNWYVGTTDDLHVYFENGLYNIKLKKETLNWNTNKTVDIDQSRDFEIKTRMLKTDGAEKFNYGILFGMLDIYNFYMFNITGDGKHAIGKVENEKITYFDDWKDSKAVNKYSTAISYNEFRIVKKGNTIYYYLNENELYNRPFSKFFGNGIAFFITGKQEIGIDYLELNYLD